MSTNGESGARSGMVDQDLLGRATIDDVARAAGVSTATVSRALANHPYVAVGTKQRVLAAVEQLRYVVNPNASRLASGQTRTIGMLSPHLTSWYTSEVVAGVEEVLTEGRYDLLIGTANPVNRERMFRGDASFQQRTDGILLVDVFCSEDGARQLAQLGAPVVVLGEQLSAVTSVSVDNASGARMAARHLIELGHKRIALIGGRVHNDMAQNVPVERIEGFSAALQAAGLRLRPQWVKDGRFTIAGGYQAMVELLGTTPKPPTAVFLLSDEMGFGAIQALRERGLQVGREVSLIGFDDHPASVAFGLSTIRQPVREMGRLGARLMLDHLAGFGRVLHHPVQLELVHRLSSAAPVG